MAFPTPVITPAPLVVRAPIDITLPSEVTLPTSLINSVLSQIPSEYGTYQLPSSVPPITIHYSGSGTPTSSTTPLSSTETSSSTSSSPASSSSTSKPHKSSNTSLLAGVFVAVGLLALLLIILLVWLLRRRRRKQKLDQDMAEAAIVPRGTVSRSGLHHIRGGDEAASERTRSLLSDQSSFMRPAVAAAAVQTPSEDYAGVGAYAGRQQRSSAERQWLTAAAAAGATRSPLSPQDGSYYQSPTYTDIMSPRPDGLATQESGYTPYVAPVHHDGYFPPVFDVPDTRYAALGARDPFADRRTPSTESSELSSELVPDAPHARRRTVGPYEDPHYPFPQTPVAYYPDAATPAPADARSAYLAPQSAESSESSAMVFAPTEGYRTTRRSGSATNYGDWFTGGGRTFPAGAAPPAAASPGTSSSEYWSGSSSSGEHGQGAAPFPGSSGGALASIPEGEGALRPPPAAHMPVTPAEVSDESDYKAARGLRVANQ